MGIGVMPYDVSMAAADRPCAEARALKAEERRAVGSRQFVPPLPAVEPVRPTYAERGQNYHFETTPDVGVGTERQRTWLPLLTVRPGSTRSKARPDFWQRVKWQRR